MSQLTSQSETVSCPAGKLVLGGGASINPNNVPVFLSESYPLSGNPAGWKVTLYDANFGAPTVSVTITVYAVCSV
jgi:hypothetical protein